MINFRAALPWFFAQAVRYDFSQMDFRDNLGKHGGYNSIGYTLTRTVLSHAAANNYTLISLDVDFSEAPPA